MTGGGFLGALLGAVWCVGASLAWAQPQPNGPLRALDTGSDLLSTLAPDPLIEPMILVLRKDAAHAGTWLDMAVALCQRQRGEDARRVLLHIERTLNPPDGIREIIRLLRNEPCDPRLRSLRVQVSMHRGVDNNVNQGASTQSFELGSAFPGVVLNLSDEFLPQRDQLNGLDSSLAWSPAAGWLLTGQLRKRSFDRLQAFNSVSGVLSMDREWTCARWRCGLGASLGSLDLGGLPYQRLASAQWGIQTQADAAGQQWLGEVGLARQRFPNQPMQDAAVATARLGWRRQLTSGAVWQLGVNVGADRPTGSRAGGARSLYGVSAGTTQPLPKRFSFETSFSAQQTRDSEVYSPGLIDVVRSPLVSHLSLTLVRPIDDRHRVRLEYRQVASRDTVNVFSYRSQALSVAWTWRGDF